MPHSTHDTSPAAYACPLLIRHLLHTPLSLNPDQRIECRGTHRLT